MRLYVITDEDPEIDRTVAAVTAALEGGADVIQVRKKTMGWDDLLRLCLQVRELARRHGALFIVNDHPDLALEADADGVHLGQEDPSPATVRLLRGFGDRLIGRSTHSLAQALQAVLDGADYIGVGPVFATPTKAGRPPVGVELVREVAVSVPLPFVAVGGIDQHTVAGVVEAGARAVAVVRAVSGAPDPIAAARELREAVVRSAAVRA